MSSLTTKENKSIQKAQNELGKALINMDRARQILLSVFSAHARRCEMVCEEIIALGGSLEELKQ